MFGLKRQDWLVKVGLVFSFVNAYRVEEAKRYIPYRKIVTLMCKN